MATEDKNEGNEFEAITLSNLWLKEHVLDLLSKIEKCEIVAYNGSEELVDLMQLNPDQIMNLRLNGFNLMRSYVRQLLHNVQHHLDKNVVLKLKINLNRIDDEEGNFVFTSFNDVAHTEKYSFTKDFYDALDMLSSVNSDLIAEIADKEILMPKKASGKDESMKGDIEDD